MIRFNKKQLDRISEFYSNIALVLIASIITPVFTGFEMKIGVTIYAILLIFSLIIVSLIIIK